jgi:hypothetical protein
MNVPYLFIFIYILGFLTTISCKQKCPEPMLLYQTNLGAETPSEELSENDTITISLHNFPNIFVGVWPKDSLNYYRYRYLLQINLSMLPKNAEIDSAFITFYPTKDTIIYPNIQPALYKNYGDNSMYIQKITTRWNLNNIFWSTQPTSTLVNQISVANIGTGNSGSGKISILPFVKDWVADSASNYGMVFKMQDETTLTPRRVYFASNYTADSSLHPLLQIYYRK